MKNNILNLCLVLFIGFNLSLYAQQENNSSETKSNCSAFYDFTENELNNTDTIPGFESKSNKLKIFGTIYKSDGVTPAKDIILYIEQADENGNFDLRKEDGKQFLHYRSWVKTDADGNYSFYTFIPGNDRRFNQMQMIFPMIKEPSKPEYEIATFLFDTDPLLSKHCRKRMAKKGDVSRILKLEKKEGLLIAKKHIILQEGLAMVD